MINIAICDDDMPIAHQLENLILETCQKEGIRIGIEVYYSGSILERDILAGERYDLIYLDIEMDKIDGISVAKSIRTLDDNVMFVFVSSYEKYVIELFRLDVFSFIKKPIEEESFVKTFLDAYFRICNKNYYYKFKYKNHEYKVPLRDILYFESDGRKVKIYVNKVNDGKKPAYTFNGKLSDVEKDIENEKTPFLRIHQSYLVNYFLIRSRSKVSVRLVNDKELPVSQDRQKEFNMEYGKLLGGEVNG